MRGLIILLFAMNFMPAVAQDLSGTWMAKSTPNSYYFTPSKVVVELHQNSEGELSGVSHFYYPGNYYEHFRLAGSINKKTKQIIFTEDSLINHRTQPGATVVSGTYFMKLRYENKKMIMTGLWQPNASPSLTYVMEKDIPEEIIKYDTVKNTVTIPPPLKNDRLDKVMKVLEVDLTESDSIAVEVYDNGEVDGDTVTVFLNKEIVINQKRISAKPLTFSTKLSKEKPIVQIRMVANNLGSIPPNTAMMIITTKKNRYTVSLSSDLKTNGVIELFLKE